MIKKLCSMYNIKYIRKITLLNSSQNKVYKIDTLFKNYCIKEYSNDAISNMDELDYKIEQIRVSKEINNNGINTIVPIKYNENYFIEYNNHYYLIYLLSKSFNKSIIDISDIDLLATTMAKLHLLKITNKLKCSYKLINIDYDKYLKEFELLDKNLYLELSNNIDKLKLLTDNCNSKYNMFINNLCINHNDYKLLNILFDKYNNITLIDFDALGLSNPIVSLAESSFSLSRINHVIDYNLYKEYITKYISIYGSINTNYMDALDFAMNGKLSWLEYLFSKCSSDTTRINDSISMIKELVYYIDNIDNMYKAYIEVIR